ncbi:MAG: hypothetical protein Q8S00_01570 [Deltaproteobacteria bacterium]|nr:hypothetical protein [Deltaproteobacteria bacterium]MDZ4340902.1 hypothetical protein [Candidatus Binatia bacterium]
MAILLSRDEALDIAFRRDSWLWVKIPVALFLGWTFFLPQLWKIGVLGIAVVLSTFRVDSPVGVGVTTFHLNAMLIGHALTVFGVLWYTVYVLAFLCSAGWQRKIAGICALLAFPIVVILAALLLGITFDFLGIPQEQIWAYSDSWTPIVSWRVSP